MLERSEWLERVLALANIVLDLEEERIRAAAGKPWFREYVLDRVEAYLRESPAMMGDHLDYIRHTGLPEREFEASWWKEADEWSSVLFNVSFHCLAHDVAAAALEVLEGKAPRRKSPLNFEREDNGGKD